MASSRVTFSSPDVSMARLRVKLAQTTHRRLSERGVPLFEQIAPDMAIQRGVKRGEDTHTFPDGFTQDRKPNEPSHYLDSFSATVEGGPDSLPITLVGANSVDHANIIENGRGATFAKPKNRSKLLWPGASGEAVFAKRSSSGGVAGKHVIRDALKLAISRASR